MTGRLTGRARACAGIDAGLGRNILNDVRLTYAHKTSDYIICKQPTSTDNESTTHTSWRSFSMQTQWKENGMFATAVADSPVELVVALMGATGLPESTSWSMSAVGLPCWTTELVLALASMPGLAATVWTTFAPPIHIKHNIQQRQKTQKQVINDMKQTSNLRTKWSSAG